MTRARGWERGEMVAEAVQDWVKPEVDPPKGWRYRAVACYFDGLCWSSKFR